MRESWPHASPHYFTPRGTYLITAATLNRIPLFDSGVKLDLFRDTTFELARSYSLVMQRGRSFPITIILLSASKIARQHIATSCNICIVNWRCGSTELIMLRVGE